jgi:hypothetical protein
MRFPVALFLTASLLAISSCAGKPSEIQVSPATAERLAGIWKGGIMVSGVSLTIQVEFLTNAGKVSARFMSVSQGSPWIWLQDLSLGTEEVSFVLRPQLNAAANFHGRISNTRIAGTFVQAGITGAFEIAKAGSADPETAGTEYDIPVSNGTLSATYLTPKGKKNFPAVLLVSGSGPTDRDGNNPYVAGQPDSMRLLAEALAQSGIASLRFDKRGVAKSRGAMVAEKDIRVELLADDTAACAKWLRARPGVTRLVIAGHSEGALMATLAAPAVNPDGVVLLEGAGRKASDILLIQLTNQPEALQKESSNAVSAILSGKPYQSPPELASLFRESVQPYLAGWFAVDPAAELKKVKAPVLIVSGTADRQIFPQEAAALRTARPDASFAEFTNMSHLLKTSVTNAGKSAIGDPSEPLAKGLTERVAEFVEELR